MAQKSSDWNAMGIPMKPASHLMKDAAWEEPVIPRPGQVASHLIK